MKILRSRQANKRQGRDYVVKSNSPWSPGDVLPKVSGFDGIGNVRGAGEFVIELRRDAFGERNPRQIYIRSATSEEISWASLCEHGFYKEHCPHC